MRTTLKDDSKTKLNIKKALNFMIWAYYIMSSLVVAWVVISYFDVMIHNTMHNGIELMWRYNFFVLLFG